MLFLCAGLLSRVCSPSLGTKIKMQLAPPVVHFTFHPLSSQTQAAVAASATVASRPESHLNQVVVCSANSGSNCVPEKLFSPVLFLLLLAYFFPVSISSLLSCLPFPFLCCCFESHSLSLFVPLILQLVLKRKQEDEKLVDKNVSVLSLF